MNAQVELLERVGEALVRAGEIGLATELWSLILRLRVEYDIPAGNIQAGNVRRLEI